MSHDKDSWFLGVYLLHKYYMVFDATPAMDPHNKDYLRIGFYNAEHGGEIEKGDSDRTIFDKLFWEFRPVAIAISATLFVVICGLCYLYCKTRRRRSQLSKMSREELANEA